MAPFFLKKDDISVGFLNYGPLLCDITDIMFIRNKGIYASPSQITKIQVSDSRILQSG